MKLVVSSEDISSSFPLYGVRGEQVAGLESRFMFIAEPKRKKWQGHFAFAPEQMGETWPRLLFESTSVTEKQTKKFFPSVATPVKFRKTGDIAGGFVLERFVSIGNDWINLQREERITFKEIYYGEQIIKLESPIKVEGVLSGEGWSLYYEPLDILVSAPTLAECEEDFQEELNVLYEEYVEEVDEKLTESARELKRKLLNLVKL